MRKTAQLLGLQDALIKSAGIGDDILDWITEHPTATGALLGGGVGATGGALLSAPENKLQNAILAGLAGAGIGGFGGYAIGNRVRRKREQDRIDKALKDQRKEMEEAAANASPEERAATEAEVEKRRQRGEDARRAYKGDTEAAKRLRNEKKKIIAPSSMDEAQRFRNKVKDLSRRAAKFRDPNFRKNMTQADREEEEKLKREVDLLIGVHYRLQSNGVRNLPNPRAIVHKIAIGYDEPGNPVDLPTNTPVDMPVNAPVDMPTDTPVDLKGTGTPVDKL